eukprot:6383103-Pyramimonas_sp.AAC.1
MPILQGLRGNFVRAHNDSGGGDAGGEEEEQEQENEAKGPPQQEDQKGTDPSIPINKRTYGPLLP